MGDPRCSADRDRHSWQVAGGGRVVARGPGVWEGGAGGW